VIAFAEWSRFFDQKPDGRFLIMVILKEKTGFELVVDQDTAPGFREWIFCPGMLFQSTDKWWGKRGKRNRPHEGLDLLVYLDHEGTTRHIDETFPIPMLADGRIVGVMPDFLGESIIVEHPSPEGKTENILTMYGHTHPLKHVKPGVAMKKDDIVAMVAGRGQTAFTMSPHLHITIARTLSPVSYDTLTWDVISIFESLVLLDPLDFINFPFMVVEADSPVCLNASPMPRYKSQPDQNQPSNARIFYRQNHFG
jgi:murein DD-endopeptidase MepM/ murein hydrolase activator NlpD